MNTERNNLDFDIVGSDVLFIKDDYIWDVVLQTCHHATEPTQKLAVDLITLDLITLTLTKLGTHKYFSWTAATTKKAALTQSQVMACAMFPDLERDPLPKPLITRLINHKYLIKRWATLSTLYTASTWHLSSPEDAASWCALIGRTLHFGDTL